MSKRKIILVLSDGERKSLLQADSLLSEKYSCYLAQASNLLSVFEFKTFQHDLLLMNKSQFILSYFQEKNCDQVYVFSPPKVSFDFFRVMVKEKQLKPEELEVLWIETMNEKTTTQSLAVDSDGRLLLWPQKLFSIEDDLLSRLL